MENVPSEPNTARVNFQGLGKLGTEHKMPELCLLYLRCRSHFGISLPGKQMLYLPKRALQGKCIIERGKEPTRSGFVLINPSRNAH